MKIPRDITGKDLIKKLEILGYTPTRQVGSHVRLTTQENGQHHITIPYHNPIKIGTLSAILKDIASHFKVSKESIAERVF
ncbi:MAG: type II toxin-antitoxin system HicA family toxin [Imperialibacter sp.]|uniref:type II toxin-antitoxin system HicA family toxin n=1 Tax=Imperialibacter sp. TaxID=2038411 RepID=UPI0032EBE232